MFAILVDLVIKKEFADQFRDTVIIQGTNSRAKEKGCLQFEVLQDPEAPNKFTLYEVYTDKATFYDVHRTTPHFAKYAETTGPWVESRNLRILTKIWPV
ncbi:MAG: putative quinol monooxygenase [Treponemataceae bacterium]